MNQQNSGCILKIYILFKIVSLNSEMATTQEGYGVRYQKIKTNKLRSVSPSHYAHGEQSPRSQIHNNSAQTQLGKVVSQLSDRVDGIQIKIVNITNIIKLFQKYTETKDNQYQKEKQSEELRNNNDERGHIESLQIQAKINQFESMMQKARTQITAMEGLRMSIERQNSKKMFSSPDPFETIPKTIQSPNTNTNSKQIMCEIEDIMDQMELNLREEMNKKIDICMTFFKSATQSFNNTKSSSPSTVNAIMMQQQIHNITLTMNKIESDCNRNKMIIENKMDQIVDYVNTIKKKAIQVTERQTSRHSKSPIKNSRRNEIEENYSEHSSISKRSRKSKSKDKSRKNITDTNVNEVGKSSRAQEQKKQKQVQLKEALRKKKQNQQKLKMKK